MAQIVTTKNGTTNEIQYPRTVKSALLNDDGTPLNPMTQANIVNDLTTGGETNVLSAQQGVAINSAIGQLQDDIGNIDVSWDAITGKPTTFTPATHAHSEYMPTGNAQAYNNYVSGVTDHAQLLWNHGNIIVQSPSESGTPMISFHSQGATAVGLYEDGCRLYTTGSDGRNSRRLLDTDDYNSLFQSVVNGKQAVVNAINGSVGYASGLTTNHTHDDYAWWIQNKVNGMSDAEFTRLMPHYAVTAAAIKEGPKYSVNMPIGSTYSRTSGRGDGYYSPTLTITSDFKYIMVADAGFGADGTLVSTAELQIYPSPGSYYYQGGCYYTGHIAKVIKPGIFYCTSYASGWSGNPYVDKAWGITQQSLDYLNGKIT